MKLSIKYLLLSLLVSMCLFSCGKEGKTEIPPDDDTEIPPKKDQYPGLSVSANGELLLNGLPYKGIGVNYFNGFTRTLDEGQYDDDSYKIGFAYLKERNIPFIRFSLAGYWPKNWNLYLTDKEKFFQNLDAFVKSAEEFEIGLIPSFFWHTPTVPDLVGEPVIYAARNYESK